MEEDSMPSIRGSMANKADTLDKRGKAEGGGCRWDAFSRWEILSG